MAVSGNITTLSIDDADLTALYPALDRYRPASQADWSIQIAKGVIAALKAFRVGKQQEPDRAKAVEDDDWKLVLAYFTLDLIFAGFGPDPEWQEMRRIFRDDALEHLGTFLYQYDVDDSGAIETGTEDEEKRSFGSIELVR